MLTVKDAYSAGFTAAASHFKLATALPLKTGAIFGAEVPEAIEHAAIPYDHRRKLYEDYTRAKAQEQPTGYGTAMGIGGGLGAAAGAGLGALMGHPGSMAGGAALGGGLGGLFGGSVGAMMAHGDKSKIQDAQQVMSHEDNIDPALAEQIQAMIAARQSNEEAQHGLRDWRDRGRHNEVMDSLRRRNI